MIRAARPESLPAPTDRFVVVEASAGTGKTYFLEHRVVDLILGGAELDQILLVTFTDKAVAELRMRIRDLLDRLARQTTDTAAPGASAWELDDAARSRLRAAVMAFDHAPIFTIHGFCHRVLIEDAFAAHRLFEQTQIADEIAFEEAFSGVLREDFARQPADKELLSAYLEAGKTIDDLRLMLLRCARTGSLPRAMFDRDAIRSVGDALVRVLGTQELRAKVVASGQKRHSDSWLLQIGDALQRVVGAASPARVLAAIDVLRDAAGKLLDHLKAPAPGLVEALRSVGTTISLDEAIAGAFLPRVLTRVEANKAEDGQFDYDDMLDLVDRALRGDRGEELATRLRTRTPWVMIDEFQDTDPTQWNIFRTVWTCGEISRQEISRQEISRQEISRQQSRGLVIVGDPKQAIYGFRGADVQTYLSARDELVRLGATQVDLDVNRRSTAQLVEGINKILVGAFGMSLLQGDIEYDKPVRPCGEVVCEEGEPIVVFAMQGPKPEPNRTALASAIGVEIEALRASPPRWRGRNGEQPFALGQVMVLTRSNAESAEIARALRSRGLPCALVESDKLFETREAAELAALLAAVASPRDRSARLRALRTRFFDVPWSELMKVVDAPDHHPLIARLYDWAQLAAHRAYEPLFRKIIEDSRFAERALVLGGGERALTNTWHLLELLLDEVAHSRSDLHELVMQLRRWISAGAERFDDRDVQRAETDADAIRVLTVHKAKGLEAPYVFLYGGTSGSPPGVKIHTLHEAAERWLVVNPQDPAIVERVDKEIEAEHQRLAYVALTRAQIRLYLPHYGDQVVYNRMMYAPIQRCLKPHVIGPGAAASRALFRTIEVPVGAEEATPPPLDALGSFSSAQPPDAGELAPIDALHGGLATLSYTRLAHDLEAVLSISQGAEIDPSEFDVDDATGQVAADELPPGAASGLMLHDMLEIADLALVRNSSFDVWSQREQVIEQLQRTARDRGISESYLPHAARVVHATLTEPLRLADGHELPPLADAPRFAREIEFSFPLPGVPVRGLVRGYIDVLVSWNDELWVLDYKSDALAGENLVAAATERARARYGVQARLYGIAADKLRGSRRLAGLLFAFVRHGVVVPVRTDDAMIASWTTWLGSLGATA